MKNILRILALLCAATEIPAQTNYPVMYGSDTSVPKQFSDLTQSNVCTGLLPVGIYKYRDGRISFTDVGTMFFTDATNAQILLPKHMFVPNTNGNFSYVVRPMRPIQPYWSGTLTKIVCTNKNLDIAVAAFGYGVGSLPVITNFVKEPYSPPFDFYQTNHVTIEGKEVKSLQSLTSGTYVKILGYGTIPKWSLLPRQLHHFVLIDHNSIEGTAGSAYLDQDKRIFIVVSGFNLNGKSRAALEKITGGPVEGVTCLDGPVELEGILTSKK